MFKTNIFTRDELRGAWVQGDPNLVSKVHIFGAGVIFENFRNLS